MSTDSPLLQVQALYNFKGTNNDELCLRKGDVITVTQAVDGGWWEGTLNGITGWFPSNYVKELKQDYSTLRKALPIQVPLSPNLNESRMYRSIVFQDIVDTENKHLGEMRSLISQFLNPLKECNILTDIEYSQMINNLRDICSCSKALLNMLQDLKNVSPKMQRIGGLFLQVAPLLEKNCIKYCMDHPKAVTVIESHKDILGKFMEEHGANPPGILTLTSGLSKPFRRIEKYSALLQELLRHTPENHIDRGDTQRAVCVYQDISNACSNVRKQKEMELDIMSGNIRDWQGEAIQTLGNIIHMGPVSYILENQKLERFLVLFPQTLVILSFSGRKSAFVFEGKYQLSSITITRLESSSSENCFEISGHSIQRTVVCCSTAEAYQQWIHSFQRCCGRILTQSFVPPFHSTPLIDNKTKPNLRPSSANSLESKSVNGNISTSKKGWPNWNLLTQRSSLTLQNDTKHLRNKNPKAAIDRKFVQNTNIAPSVESYGSLDHLRNNIPSTVSAPPRLNFEEDKIFFEDANGDIKEKTLVDTVYFLKDQVQELKEEISSLKLSLIEERQARKQLQDALSHFLSLNSSTQPST